MPLAKGRSGLNPASYMGVEAVTPPDLNIINRRPTVNDLVSFNIGSLWVMTSPQEIWMLVSKSNYTANWVQLYPGAGGGATDFPCDVDTASEASGILNVKGMPLKNINTHGTGNTVEVALNDSVDITGTFHSSGNIESDSTIFGNDIAALHDMACLNKMQVGNVLQVDAGGINSTGPTILNDLATAGVVQTDATGTLSTSNGTDGQVLIGGGTAPVWSTLTAGTNVSITNAANSITINASAGSGSVAFKAVQPNTEKYYLNYGFDSKQAYSKLYTSDSVTGKTQVGTYEPLNVIYNYGGGFYPGAGDGVNGAYFQAPFDGVYSFTIYLSITLCSYSTGSLVLGSGAPGSNLPNPTEGVDQVVAQTTGIGGNGVYGGSGITYPYAKINPLVVINTPYNNFWYGMWNQGDSNSTDLGPLFPFTYTENMIAGDKVYIDIYCFDYRKFPDPSTTYYAIPEGVFVLNGSFTNWVASSTLPYKQDLSRYTLNTNLTFSGTFWEGRKIA